MRNFFPEENNNVYVDLLVVVKSVKPTRTIKTKAGRYLCYFTDFLKIVRRGC